MDKTKLIIVDDHELVRLGLSALLLEHTTVEVVAMLRSGKELLSYLKDHAADIVLLDVNLQGSSGIDTLIQLRDLHPSLKAIMISGNTSGHYIELSIKNGALGYLHKDCTENELSQAIDTTMRGEMYFSSKISPSVYEAFANRLRGKNESSIDLSEREVEVLIGFAEGKSYADVADQLSISKKTVEHHKKAIFDKLKFENNAELIKYAIKKGLVEL